MRRWLKRLAVSLLVFVGVLVLLVSGAWMALSTKRGEAWLRAQVQTRVSESLKGDLTLGEVSLRADTLVLNDVVLRDPAGEVVARIERLEADLAPFALFRRTVKLDAVRITRPDLDIVRRADGTTNLSEALESENPKPPKPEEERKPLPVSIALDRLTIEGGEVSLRDPARERVLSVDGLNASGALALSRDRQVQTQFDADGEISGDLQGPLKLTLDAQGDPEKWSGEVDLRAAEARLVAQGNGEGEKLEVELEQLLVPPLLAQAISPQWPLITELRAHGSVLRTGADWTAELSIAAADARATLEGHFDQEAFQSRGVEVTVQDVNLSQLVKDGPASDLAFQLTARGGGRTLETFEGEVHATAPRSPLNGSHFGPIALHATAANGAFELKTLEADVPGVSLSARGAGTVEDVSIEGRLQAESLERFARMVGKLTGKRPPLGGRGVVTFALKGPARDPTLNFEARLPRVAWEDREVRGIVADGKVPDLGGWIRSAKPGAEPTAPLGPIVLEARVRDLGIDDLLRKSEVPVSLHGPTRAEVQLGGTPAVPSLQAKVVFEELRIEGMPSTRLSVTARSRPDGRLLLGARAEVGEAPSELSVGLPWTLAQLIEAPPTAEQALRAPLEVDGEIRELPVALLGLPPSPGGAGRAPTPRVTGRVFLRGSAQNPRGAVGLSVTGVPAGDLPPLSATADVELQPTLTRLQATLTQSGRPLAALQANVRVGVGRIRNLEALRTVPTQGELLFGPIALADVHSVLHWLRPDAPPEQFQSLPTTGVFSGTWRFDGTLANPDTTLQASLHGVGAPGVARVGDAFVKASWARSELAMEVRVLSPAGGTMDLTARTPLRLTPELLEGGFDLSRQRVTGRLIAHQLDPVFLSNATPLIGQVEGLIEADIAFSGALTAPNVEGDLTWRNGVLELSGFGRYENIQLVARGNRDRITLEKLDVSSLGGTANAKAEFVRQGAQYTLDTAVNLRKFPIMSNDQLVAYVTLDATAKGTASLERIDIPSLVIDQARADLPSLQHKKVQTLEPPAHISFLRDGAPVDLTKEHVFAMGGAGEEGREEARPRQRRRILELFVGVDAPRNVLVVSDEANVELGFSEGFRVEITDEPRIYGQVTVHRGRVELLGRAFELQEGSSATFTGNTQKPELDVVAEHFNRREDVTVRLAVTGIPPNVKVEPSSTPALSETQIYTLLATGRTEFGGGTGGGGGLTATAASALGGFLANKLERGIAQRIPLDYLQIEPGQSGFSGTRIQTGAQISDSLFIGLQSQLGAYVELDENRNELQLEYLLSRRLVLDLRYGDNRVGSFELLWRRRY